VLPGYYRAAWEEDMVAAFLDSWRSGDAADDEWILGFGRPSWSERASVVGLAGRLYLGGAGAPRRYFAWGQAVRGAVLALLLVHAMAGLAGLVALLSPGIRGWFVPAPPAIMAGGLVGGAWLTTVWYVVGCAWVVIFVALVMGRYRAARVIAVLAIVPALAWLLQGQVTGSLLSPFGSWAFWILIDLAPVVALTAFHQDAPPIARRAWLLALPAGYVLVEVPLLVAALTGHSAWVPDLPGQCCLLVALACLAHAPRAWSRRADTGVWSLTLTLLAAVTGWYRIASLGNYLQDPRLIYYGQGPHLVNVGLVELLILAVAAALVAPDAARTQIARPALALTGSRGEATTGHRGGRTVRRLVRRPAGIGLVLAALVLTAAGCSHVLPLQPTPAATQRLTTPIVLQTVLGQQQAEQPGRCPPGYATLPGPGAGFPGLAGPSTGPAIPGGGQCYRKTGEPVTITAAAVTLFEQPAVKQQPTIYGLRISLPSAEAAALIAVTTEAYNSQYQLATLVAGQNWGVAFVAQPFTTGQFEIPTQSRDQAVTLQRMLTTPA
jgi:hypothetical protein